MLENTIEMHRIMSLPAGRELDALIAELVFGEPRPAMPDGEALWSRVFSEGVVLFGECWWLTLSGYDDGDQLTLTPFRFSTDTAVAMRIVEKLRLCVVPTETGWLAGQNDPTGNDYVYGGIVDIHLRGAAEEETIALAVCRSALRLTMGEA